DKIGGRAMYEKFGEIAFLIGTIIVAAILLYNFAIYVLPWLILIAVIGNVPGAVEKGEAALLALSR
ncbi:MAG: hypothetical protein WAV27_18840, partial [Xanthobacteraceae bacterium]